MKMMCYACGVSTVAIFFSLSSFSQIPRDNPYRTFYTKYPKPYNPLPPVGQHWTDNLPWDKVYDVTQDLTKPPFNMSQNAIRVPAGTTPSAANDNIPIINEAITRLSAAGGGVLYFPAGTYCFGRESTDPNNFYDNRGSNGERYLQLKQGVILRGETPTQDVAKLENSSQNATYTNIYNTSQVFTLPFKKGTFSPPTKFVFPKYHPILSGSGMPNRSAFMKITSPNFDDNLGLCYIEINRAGIYLSPYLSGTNESKNNHRALVNFPDKKENIIVFGIRLNNHADPQDEDHLWGPFLDNPAGQVVPRSSIGQLGWQRWPFRLAAHIDIEATGNVIIANNRIGDIGGMNENEVPDDSYPQPGFTMNFNAVPRQVPMQVNSTTFSGTLPTFPNNFTNNGFEYSAQIGIRLNRKKAVNADQSSPSQEPYWYYEGNEVLDNWTYTTSLPGIMASGTGLNVSGNIKRDNFYKPVGAIQRTGAAYTMGGYSQTLGKWQTGPAADFQERGIDVSGYDVKVTYNDIMVVPTRGTNNSLFLGKYGGILVEGDIIRNIRNYEITHNTVTGSIQIENLRSNINGIVLRNNVVKSIWYDDNSPAPIRTAEVQPFILVSADGVNEQQSFGRLENVDISNNVLLGDASAPSFTSLIRVRGSLGGENCRISGNSSINQGKIVDRVPCYCKLNSHPDSSLDFNDNINLPVLNASNNSNPIVVGDPPGRRLCVSGPISVSSFSPSCARSGDRIFVNGNNLASLFAVTFGSGSSAVTTKEIEVINDNTAAVIVPTGISGLQPVTVVANGGTLGIRNGQNPDPIDNRSTSLTNFNISPTALAAPTFSETDIQEGGATLKRVTINVSSGQLYWTADGSTPNEFSNKNNVVLALDTLVINAKAFDPNASGCLRESGISSYKVVPTLPLNTRVESNPTPWRDNKAAAASLSFEGNDESFFSPSTLTALSNRNIKATFFLSPSASNTQAVKNQLRPTHEIGATSSFDLALVSNTNDSVLNELQTAQSLLDSPTFYAWLSPPPILHQQIASSVGFKGGKAFFSRSQAGYYLHTNKDFYSISTVPIDTLTTGVRFEQILNAAINGNGWVTASVRLPISSGNVPPAVYDSIVNLLASKKNEIWIAPFGQVHRYHKQYHNLRIAILDTTNGISMRIEDYLDPSYQDSITLKVRVEQGVCILSVTQASQAIPFTELNEVVGGQSKRYIVFNAKADASLLIRINYSSSVPSVNLTRVVSSSCGNALLRVSVPGTLKTTDSIFVSLNGGPFSRVRNDSLLTLTERTNVTAYLKADAGVGCGFINGPLSFIEVKPKLCAPVIAPNAGFYIDSVLLSVTNRTSLPPATIVRYAINSSQVNSLSPVLADNAVSLQISSFVSARAFHPDYDSSDLVQVNYAIESRRAIEPQVKIDTVNQRIIIVDFNGPDSIYYTTDGTVPSLSSTRLMSSVLPIAPNGTYRFVRYALFKRPSIVVTAKIGTHSLRPNFMPRPGVYAGSQTITISASSSDTIYYTTNGSEPSVYSQRIIGSGAVVVPRSSVIKAVVQKNGVLGEVISASYIIDGAKIGKLLKPSIQSSLSSNGQLIITIQQSGTSIDSFANVLGRKIYYTTDGTIPSTDTLSTTSKLYTSSFVLASGRGTVTARAFADNFLDSDTAVLYITDAQTVTLATPLIQIVNFGTNKIITFDSIRAGVGNASTAFLTNSIARIFYTIDGSEPTLASRSYVFGTNALRDTLEKSAIVRFRAIPLFEQAGFSPSPMDSVSVEINNIPVVTLPQPQLTTVSKSVTNLPYDVARLNLNGLDTTIANVWYTTDGSEPSPSLGKGRILRADSIVLIQAVNNIRMIAYPKPNIIGYRPSSLNNLVVNAVVDVININFTKVSNNQAITGSTVNVTKNERIRVTATSSQTPIVSLSYQVGNATIPITGNEVEITCRGRIQVIANAIGAEQTSTSLEVRLVDTMLVPLRVSNFITSSLGTVTQGAPITVLQNGSVSITGNQFLTLPSLPNNRTIRYRFAGSSSYQNFPDTIKLRDSRAVETEVTDVCYSEPFLSSLTVNYTPLPKFKLLYRIGANAIFAGGEIGNINISTNSRTTLRIVASPDGNKLNPNFIAGLQVFYSVRDRLTGAIISDTSGTERELNCVARIVVNNAFVPLGTRDTLYADLSGQNNIFDINNTYPIMSEATVNLGGVILLPNRTNVIRSSSDNTIQMYITFANRGIAERVVDKLYYSINNGPAQLYTPSATTTLIRTDIANIKSITISAEDACYSALPTVTFNTNILVSGLQLEDISEYVSVYPNPAAQKAKVNIRIPDVGELQIRLRSIVGTVIKSYNFEKNSDNADYEIDITEISSGIYLLETTIGNKRSIQKLMVK
ncbi:MAG: chitobiase/beta-hexosaminidase C-terminal domain-containing protein [Cytophagales bacterium]|nr:chitobiase/beta-hexosaminidase C-terminal domain-containing protein [Cytophagales bacterium]MDW8383510.1 chitobiase/beta-hexosaminidase C-terminal domain-containing protein [Flammeovirgaceae bacterium]